MPLVAWLGLRALSGVLDGAPCLLLLGWGSVPPWCLGWFHASCCLENGSAPLLVSWMGLRASCCLAGAPRPFWCLGWGSVPLAAWLGLRAPLVSWMVPCLLLLRKWLRAPAGVLDGAPCLLLLGWGSAPSLVSWMGLRASCGLAGAPRLLVRASSCLVGAPCLMAGAPCLLLLVSWMGFRSSCFFGAPRPRVLAGAPCLLLFGRVGGSLLNLGVRA